MRNAFELLARLGYAARGAVYLVAAFIALGSVASGIASDTSPEGALSFVRSIAFGQALLAVLAAGLVGHSLWRLAQSVLNADNHDGDAKGWVTRASLLVSGVAHASLALAAAKMALGMQSGGGGSGNEGVVRMVMSQPFGTWLVGLLGAVVIIVGLAQIYRGVKMTYRKWIDLPRRHEKLYKAVCTYGLAARGALFIIAGGFICYAALTVDPQDAGSMAEALDWVRQLPFGSIVYTLAALGLLAFGLYSIIEAIYRRVDAPEELAVLGRRMKSMAG